MPSNEELFLGLDIGGTKCSAVVGRRSGEIVAHFRMVSRAERGPEKMLLDIFAAPTSYLRSIPIYVQSGRPWVGRWMRQMELSSPRRISPVGIEFRFCK